jgi:hypothetical protein
MKIELMLCLFICFSLASCDYSETCDYVILNKTSDTIEIKTIIGYYDNGIDFYDSIHRIIPGEKLNFLQDLGLCGSNYYPPDYFSLNDTIPPVTRFDIFISDKLFDTLRLRKFWIHSSRKQIGTYTLTITQELIDEL